MTKKDCRQCHDNEYNHGLGGSKECWMFETAELVMKKEIHIDQIPPYNQKAKLFPNCYHRQRYCYMKE